MRGTQLLAQVCIKSTRCFTRCNVHNSSNSMKISRNDSGTPAYRPFDAHIETHVQKHKDTKRETRTSFKPSTAIAFKFHRISIQSMSQHFDNQNLRLAELLGFNILVADFIDRR
eukprot:GILK01010204.1.p1 GENE.GILK01010204.1~~GILK01010204.1.p1  ORF type:complete len:114 (-),score=3.74 GILK01010204.1:21-362(-)